jgi:hypothetical protein
MAGLFKTPKVDKGPTPPSPDDERQRKAALAAQETTGGRASTILTQGLAMPLPRDAAPKAPRTVLTS